MAEMLKPLFFEKKCIFTTFFILFYCFSKLSSKTVAMAYSFS